MDFLMMQMLIDLAQLAITYAMYRQSL